MHYVVVMDINMMLVGGFGFLMTFLKRYNFSAIGFTLIVVTFVTEWTILLNGFVKLDETFTIRLTFMEYVYFKINKYTKYLF